MTGDSLSAEIAVDGGFPVFFRQSFYFDGNAVPCGKGECDGRGNG